MSLRRLSGGAPPLGAYTTPGAMSHYVTIQAPGPRDSLGNFGAPTVFAQTWAAIRDLTGREIDKTLQRGQMVQVVITVPYLAGLSAAFQVVNGSDTYQIQYIEDPDARQVEQRLFCSLTGQTE